MSAVLNDPIPTGRPEPKPGVLAIEAYVPG